MRILFFTFFLFLSFDTLAVVTVSLGSMNCTMSPNLHHPQVGLTFKSQADAKAHLTGLVATYATATCSGFAYTTYSYAANGIYSGRYTYRFDRKYAQLSFNGIDGCTYSECQSIAENENECESEGKELDTYEYVSTGSGDFTKTCKDLPPEEPINNAEECTDLANNQCYAHNGFSGNLTFDDGATSGSVSCDYTCNDGTTGDKNGSNANDPNGICEANNPNDLADCDVADNVDPDCVIGCGDAFTPDPTTDLDYNPDGTTSSDGTGTDGITTTQGDVLINEVIKLKNNNAEQIIKGSNKVVDAVESIDPNDKLSELITAVKDNKPLPSDGSGNNFNDTNIVSSINSLQQSVNQGAADTVSAIEGNSLNNVIGNSLAYDTSNFDSVLSDTAQLDVNIAERQQTLKDNISLYKSTLTSQLSFLTPMSNGYSTNNLVLSQGSYDVSWSRFSQYFSSIGTIVYALCALVALSILFAGRF
jgi:hypothetical protein